MATYNFVSVYMYVYLFQSDSLGDHGTLANLERVFLTSADSMCIGNSSLKLVEENYTIVSPLDSYTSTYGQWLTFWSMIPKGASFIFLLL